LHTFGRKKEVIAKEGGLFKELALLYQLHTFGRKKEVIAEFPAIPPSTYIYQYQDAY
jgi:hypothetical protein